MQRRLLFACAGGLFSTGIPFGLLAMRLARRGPRRLRVLIPTTSARWSLTGSFGVATIDPGAEGEVDDAATLMRAADAALYEAKQRGRNRVVTAPTHPPGLPPREESSNTAANTVGT